MLNLAHSIRLFRGNSPPTSNDPHMQIRFNNLIWCERNSAALGRCIMAWLAIAGWAAFAVSVVN
jgi:hypothetical protein